MDSASLQRDLEACVREIHELQTSGASRSHAGPALALRALMNRYRRIKEKLEAMKAA